MDQFKNLRCQKIALIKALPMQMMHNIYILILSCEINDSTYIVDSVRADGYKRGADSPGTSAHSQSARRFQGGECSSEENKKNKKLATLSTVNSKLILHFTAKDLVCIVCTD